VRRVCYVTGSRADWGLMESSLKKIQAHPELYLEICVTGQHLVQKYGFTISDIEASELPIAAKIPVRLDGAGGEVMAHAIADELTGITKFFESNRPDVLLILGDRGEMLAAALSAIHLNIPVVHLHGGEFSGTVDDAVRHAISKLSHYHFTATDGAKNTLTCMGESPERIYVTGAPGLDGLMEHHYPSREALCETWGLVTQKPILLMLFHPVIQEISEATQQTRALLEALAELDVQVLCFSPNSDAGGKEIEEVIDDFCTQPQFRKVTHMKRQEYLSWLSNADLLVGNSSSGIIEAASFNLPVLDIGTRQKNRERSANVVNVIAHKNNILEAVRNLIGLKKQNYINVYGDGKAGDRIASLLASISLDNSILSKPWNI
jgi:GDP/UDP-N,N'-diacetylbacillosamine 2-epimerase (hydrolysing)